MLIEILALALAALTGLLAFVFKQRNDARDEAKDARQSAKWERLSREAVDKTNRDIRKGQAKVRAEAKEVQRENEAHKSGGTRPREFGDPRLREHSAGPDAD